MALTVYLETSIIRYVTARPSLDLVVAARQELTREWWTRGRGSFEVYVSEAVIAEAQIGDSGAAARRLAVLEPLPVLDLTPAATSLAGAVAAALRLPRRPAADSVHIAVAAWHGIECLLT